MSLFLKYKKTTKQQSFTDAQGYTHTSMRGGCLTVPVEKRSQFFDDYFAAFKRGDLLAWTERIPLKDPFKFLLDIDFAHGAENVDASQLHADLGEIVCNLCGGEMDTDTDTEPEKNPWSVCFASRCPYKLHFHFPNLIVNRKNALGIAKRAKRTLEQKYPMRAPVKGKPGKTESAWIKIVDTSIYEGGIRLLGSRKSPTAEDKERKDEEERLGKENVEEIPLLYKMTLPDGTQFDLERSHLDLCSIFADPGTELTPLPGLYAGEEGDVADEEESEGETAVERRPKKIRKKPTKPQTDESDDSDQEDDESNRVKIPKEVRQELAEITGIETGHLRYGKMGTDSIEIVTHSPDCPFSAGGHKSNHQRLFISATSVVQKCHSKKCAKKKKPYVCQKACEWFLSFHREEMDAPRLDKKMIRMLHNPDTKRHNQPLLTGYLNRFLAYIHQNDSYGVRMVDHRPFDICRKAAVVNKMERFETDVSPFSAWCANENRKEFDHVVFDTSDKKYPSTTLNLFRGYKAKMLDRVVSAEEVETFLYHLRDVICQGDEENFHYYLRWWAWFFQKGRTGIMVLLLSTKKGTGKNIILELLAEHIIGDQYVATTDKIDTIVQRFNAIMVEKALIVANELKDASKSPKENGRVEEVMKTAIKDRMATIEKKGIDPITVPSTTNFHGSSNYLVPLKIDQDQRRYLVLEVSDHKKGDKPYFTELARFVETKADEIFTYLNQIDLTGWHPEFDLVQTIYTKRIQRAFINPIYMFWGEMGWVDHDFEKIPHKKADIFNGYVAWCTATKRTPRDDGWFGREVAAMGYTLKQQMAHGVRERVIVGRMSDAAKALLE